MWSEWWRWWWCWWWLGYRNYFFLELCVTAALSSKEEEAYPSLHTIQSTSSNRENCIVSEHCAKHVDKKQSSLTSLFWPRSMLENEKWSPSTDGRETSSWSGLYEPLSPRRETVWALKLQRAIILSFLGSSWAVWTQLKRLRLQFITPLQSSQMTPTHKQFNKQLIGRQLTAWCMQQQLHYIIYSVNYYMYYLIVLTYS